MKPSPPDGLPLTVHVMTCNFLAMTSRLQAELKQTKPFPRRSSEALLSVLRTAALLEHQLNEVLRPYGITDLQYNVLRILRGAGPNGWCGREISERLVSKVPDVSRLLDRMESMQLIRRERDETDRRHVTARITPKGLRVLDEATVPLDAFERERFGHFDADLLQQIIDGLADVRSAL
jgi:MarR family transcriptional regulator, organic hydroperoxide resistance regulator